jgi:hypothetical protein
MNVEMLSRRTRRVRLVRREPRELTKASTLAGRA